MCDSSKIGSFDLVKNSFAAEPGTHTNRGVHGNVKLRFTDKLFVFVCVHVLCALTRYEAIEVRLNGFELVNIILSLLICNLPGIVIATGLSLDLIGHCC